MAEYKKIKRIEITGDFNDIRIIEDIIELENEEIKEQKLNHSRVIHAGDDYINEDKRIKDLCALLHKATIVDARKKYLAEQE